MTLEDQLKSNVQEVIKTLYSADIEKSNIKIDKTPPEFEGEMTVVIFPFSKISKKSPDITANEIGTALLKHGDSISKFNVIKGFLNISFSDNHWLNVLKDVSSLKNYHTHVLTGIIQNFLSHIGVIIFKAKGISYRPAATNIQRIELGTNLF